LERIKKESDFVYKPPPPPILKIIIPDHIINDCRLVNKIKKHLKEISRSNNLLKYETFANLGNLRENMLYIIRKNYISREEIINIAFKQYKCWSNLRDEDIKKCIKDNSLKYVELKVADDAPSIQKNYRKYFPFHAQKIIPNMNTK
jgi:hypothetical protein